MHQSEVFLKKILTLIPEPIKIRTHKGLSILFSFCTRDRVLSLQEQLLEAPLWVAEIIADFIKGKKLLREEKEQVASQLYRGEKTVSFDPLPGSVYDLRKIYDRVNTEYFDGKIDCQIGWFGRSFKKTRSRITLGDCHYEQKVIRIHRSLDRKEIPEVFVEFVIYHEMVHCVIGAEKSSNGRRIIHSSEFRNKERLFKQYDEVVAWEKQHQHILLTG